MQIPTSLPAESLPLSATADTDAATSDAERRTLLRLRDLCDEVIVARQVEQGDEPIRPEERQQAREMLRQIAPRIGQRERTRD
jgi:hypothetical protein